MNRIQQMFWQEPEDMDKYDRERLIKNLGVEWDENGKLTTKRERDCGVKE